MKMSFLKQALLPLIVSVVGGCIIGEMLWGGLFRPAITPARWSVEVLRTTDARGMTYSSLHDARGEPETTGPAMKWTDEEGRKWVFVNGALAHELDPKPQSPSPSPKPSP